MRLIGVLSLAVGVVVVAAPIPLLDPLAVLVRLLGVLFAALGVWVAVAPGPEPEDDFILDHADAVRDLFAEARDRLMTVDVAELDDRVCRHAEVILRSKYYA